MFYFNGSQAFSLPARKLDFHFWPPRKKRDILLGNIRLDGECDVLSDENCRIKDGSKRKDAAPRTEKTAWKSYTS